MKYTEAQILDLFEKSPAAVQEMLSSQELLDVIIGFQKNYGLHTDMVGKIAELTRNLLLGITSPTEFFGELVLVGASPDVAKKIVDELNEKIFVPVRAKMQGDPATESPEPPQRTVTPEPSPISVPVPEIVAAPQPELPRKTVQQEPLSVLAPQVAPVPPPAPMIPTPAPLPIQHEAVPPLPAPAYVASTTPMRTMAHDIETMTDGSAPAPASYMPPAPPAPPPPAITTPSPVQEVGTAPILSAPVIPPQTPSPSHKEVVSTLKKYGIDPYHEPLE